MKSILKNFHIQIIFKTSNFALIDSLSKLTYYFVLLVLAYEEFILTFCFLHDLLIESLSPRILGILCHLVQIS